MGDLVRIRNIGFFHYDIQMLQLKQNYFFLIFGMLHNDMLCHELACFELFFTIHALPNLSIFYVVNHCIFSFSDVPYNHLLHFLSKFTHMIWDLRTICHYCLVSILHLLENRRYICDVLLISFCAEKCPPKSQTQRSLIWIRS